jgi:hypothetical protein
MEKKNRVGRLTGRLLLHQKHLTGSLDRAVQPPLIVRGQARVLAGEDSSLVSNKLAEQVGVFEVQGINGKIDLWFRARRPALG